MLQEMAKAGNPASKDHDALLVDLERIVEGLTGGAPLEGTTDEAEETSLPGFDFQDPVWSDVDWMSLLNTGLRPG